MPKVDKATFYLQPAAGGDGDKFEYHFMSWRRIIELFHPSKATSDFTRVKYYELCIKRLDAALTEKLREKKTPQELQEIKDLRDNLINRFGHYAS